MNQPAVPDYVTAAGDFTDCPPGHRFKRFFSTGNTGWLRDKNGNYTTLLREALARLLSPPAPGS